MICIIIILDCIKEVKMLLAYSNNSSSLMRCVWGDERDQKGQLIIGYIHELPVKLVNL